MNPQTDTTPVPAAAHRIPAVLDEDCRAYVKRSLGFAEKEVVELRAQIAQGPRPSVLEAFWRAEARLELLTLANENLDKAVMRAARMVSAALGHTTGVLHEQELVRARLAEQCLGEYVTMGASYARISHFLLGGSR
jgi:hypothetical protein